MDYQTILSKRVQQVKPSGIRKFFDIANEMEGVISLGVGEPDFKTPFAIRAEGIRTLERGKTWYSANAGLMELRTEICRYLERRFGLSYEPKSDVFVTVGGSEAIDLCLRALVDPGEEVLIPEPSFVCYTPLVEMIGGVPVPIETKAENQFRLTKEELLEKVTDKTKVLVLPYPNNPTGGVMRKEHLEEIAEVLRERNIMVLSDEIYAELTYNGKHVSIASIEGMKERTVVVNGFSKAYAMTGWRLGYAAGPAPVIKQMVKIHQFAIMCAPTTSQYAAVEALRNGDESIEKMATEYNMRRRLIVNEFNRLGLPTFEPEGAFYIFPCIKSTGLTSEEFCEKLLFSQKVAVVPGTAFGNSGEGFIRVSYSYSVNHILEAVERIRKFLETL
ncbi:Putative aminotransferase A [uncultured Ruminococcus sp.]|uniref:Aminotransferase n=1 Tax=Massiliimalia timonensis TaxID=1987501 RepID=A0A8J6PFN9_9FIRM|nr:aminotransferase class I/II-fold pyridoxal phosphate-dependent enzyme [Massiliimalia timonensis]MBC8611536.1 aminotransferase class I/II-fold pyridoxal phosphate-dependent enzyme [Massiliimalia timonensis]SCH01590.1 Putative aminotransferase A [uncultured Clostridium sp.]SCH97501.1 Putative aminotransferase A [uncultured Ruminococcus sp.]